MEATRRIVLVALVLTALAVVGAAPAWATPQPPASTPVNCTPIVGTGVSCPPATPSTPYGGLDHFLCYATTSDPFATPTVTIQDQFGTLGPLQPQVADSTAMSPTTNWFCNPAQKTFQNGTGPVYGVSNPQAHLMCFNDSGPTSNVTVSVTNQFGTGTMAVGAPTRLCLPSWKYDDNASTSNPLAVAGSVSPSQWTDPSNLALNHFQCYQVSTTPQERAGNFSDYNGALVVTDEFGSWTIDVGPEPSELCAPAVKTVVDASGTPLTPPSEINSDGFSGTHLLCFPIVAISGVNYPSSSTVEVGNQFSQSPVAGTPGAVPAPVTVGPWASDALAAGGFCLPSYKVVLPGSGTPEVAMPVLLPVAAVTVGGGALWMARRRSNRTKQHLNP